MKICTGNPIKEIRKIVEAKAKFQKVMLCFDSNVSNVEIGEIYSCIKDICIYNQTDIKNNLEEIYNGYRLIIYFCSATSLLNCKVNKEEFVNVYLPKENEFLPCFLNKDNYVDESESYLICDNSKVDIAMMASIQFNLFFNYLKDVVSRNKNSFNFNELNLSLNNNSEFEIMNKIKSDSFFVDVDILSKSKIDYNCLIFVDLILVDAFLLLLANIKNGMNMIVDIYKAAKDDCNLIEKFYKLYNNDSFKNYIVLNFNSLYNQCVRARNKILEFSKFFDVENCNINEIVECVKVYSKNDKGITAYLYLYNIFNV